MLDLSKIDAGKLQLDPVPVDVRKLMTAMLKPFLLGAEQKGLTMETHVDEDVPAKVMADPVRLRQVLLNLVGNAIKFTEEGEVAVTVSVRPDEQPPETGRLCLHMMVRDTGIGIRAREATSGLRRVHPGGRVDHPALRRHRTRVVDQREAGGAHGRPPLGGERARAGSRFHFTAMLDRADTAAVGTGRTVRAIEARVPTRRLRVLLFEDDIVNRMVVTRLIEKQGHTVLVAAGVHELSSVDERGVDLLLMNMQTPQFNGLDTAAAIRAREAGTGRHLLMVGMIAHPTPGDRERCLAGGHGWLCGKADQGQ